MAGILKERFVCNVYFVEGEVVFVFLFVIKPCLNLLLQYRCVILFR